MRSETCNEILMEKVAFYESDWGMPDYVRIPDANGGSRRVNLDRGYDPDADWKRLWEEEDITKRTPRRRRASVKSGPVSKAVKNVLKHASVMREAAKRGTRMAGYKPGTRSSMGNPFEKREPKNWFANPDSLKNITKKKD